MSDHARSNPSYEGFTPASEAASRAKRANRKKDTAHELILRSELWRLGLRYRKHVSGLPGNPDLVFSHARVVVFCDGDFWHGRNWDRLKAQLEKRHNAAYWVAKIARNRDRDRENTTLLERQGWLVLRLWETDIKKYPASAALEIRDVLTARIPSSSPLQHDQSQPLAADPILPLGSQEGCDQSVALGICPGGLPEPRTRR
jgi:DNA mismatch endonuclease, patch repair protein